MCYFSVARCAASSNASMERHLRALLLQLDVVFNLWVGARLYLRHRRRSADCQKLPALKAKRKEALAKGTPDELKMRWARPQITEPRRHEHATVGQAVGRAKAFCRPGPVGVGPAARRSAATSEGSALCRLRKHLVAMRTLRAMETFRMVLLIVSIHNDQISNVQHVCYPRHVFFRCSVVRLPKAALFVLSPTFVVLLLGYRGWSTMMHFVRTSSATGPPTNRNIGAFKGAHSRA